MDMSAYQAYFDGRLGDRGYDEPGLALSMLPQVAA
jgi:hypothetical protein